MLAPIGVFLLILYGVFILGKFHPLYFKAILAIVGLISVFFAYIEAIGMGMYFGLREAATH